MKYICISYDGAQVFTTSYVEEAMAYLQGSENYGYTVIQVSQDGEVSQCSVTDEGLLVLLPLEVSEYVE